MTPTITPVRTKASRVLDAWIPPLDGGPRAKEGLRISPALGSLKIVVVGTPKSGNTWLRYLLAALYDLPVVSLRADFNANDWGALGPRWVGQEHYYPTPQLRAWGRERGIVFVTPIRHPADVLVSLRHHVENQEHAVADDPVSPGFMLRDAPGVYGEHTREFLRAGFYLNLHLSICWIRGGWSHPVRYEDLWRHPLETLRALAEQIVPVSDKRLRHAICAAEVDNLQRWLDPSRKFVRKGGIGGWCDVLPVALCDMLATYDPYPAQLAALGCSMDRADPANVRSREPARVADPFTAKVFSNGVPIPPVLVQAYLDLPVELTERWPEVASIDPNSFYAWLTKPAAADPDPIARPTITELASFLYGIRADVRAVFPDPFGVDRAAFGDWFLFDAAKEYGLDRVFTLPIVQSWAAGTPLLEKTGRDLAEA